jgi:hypothetical protein
VVPVFPLELPVLLYSQAFSLKTIIRSIKDFSIASIEALIPIAASFQWFLFHRSSLHNQEVFMPLDAFVKIDGISGERSDSNLSGWIETIN